MFVQRVCVRACVRVRVAYAGGMCVWFVRSVRCVPFRSVPQNRRILWRVLVIILHVERDACSKQKLDQFK